jgi:hypothetical protein
MTEPLNDGHHETEDERRGVRVAGRGGAVVVEEVWTRRRRRNTGTRMNPLEGSSYAADEE